MGDQRDTSTMIGRFSGACYMLTISNSEANQVCGPAFYTTEPLDPGIFDDHGPAGQVIAAEHPMHDVYITPAEQNETSEDDDKPQPVHLLAWDLLVGVLFFASGKPPVPCR